MCNQAFLLDISVKNKVGVHEFLLLEDLPVNVLLGLDFLRRFNFAVSPKSGLIPNLFLAREEPVPSQDSFFGKVNPQLPADQQQQVRNLLQAYRDVFSTDAAPFGCARLVKHRIPTADARPIYQYARPTSPMNRKVIDDQLEIMLTQGVIQKSSSPWASPVTLANKQDGTKRFCVDFRALNKVTEKDRFPLPRITDLLEALGGNSFFSSIDAAAGYWQIEVEDADIPKTAFSTHQGLFEFRRMPFGLCNAPATYQRYTNELFAGLLFSTCVAYLDDLLVYANSFEQELHRLREVLERFRQSNIKLKGKKCFWFHTKITFLGHVVSREGLLPCPKKVEKLQKYPLPSNVAEVRTFLGMAGYYRRFVRNFAVEAAPLYELIQDKIPFEMTDDRIKSFERVKGGILKDAVLAHPDFTKSFLIDPDASEQGIGAVLSQNVDGIERPVYFISRRLTPAERKWHIREKEALAIFWRLSDTSFSGVHFKYAQIIRLSRC